MGRDAGIFAHGLAIDGSLMRASIEHHTASRAIEIPIPPPIHIEAMALCLLFRDIMLAALHAILAPDAPSGWPIARAPPSIFTISGSNPSSLIQAKLCEEKASFNSNTSMSAIFQPALS